VVLIFVLAFGVTPMWTWLLFPVFLGLLITYTTAVSMIVASLYPSYRDVSIIWSVFSMVLFYATPVLYPVEKVPHAMRTLIMLNPLSPLFELARKWMIDPSAPTPRSLVSSTAVLLIPIALFIGVCVFAVWIFWREAPRIAEQL
jgi:ABC-2 type transport system permease protein